MRRLIARLGLTTLLAGVPAILVLAAGPPTLPSFKGVSLSGDYLPIEAVLQVVALTAWIVWTYLAVAVLLRVFATLLSSRNALGSDSLLTASSLLMPSPLRRLVDVAVGGALIAAFLVPRESTAGRPLHHHVVAAVDPVASKVAKTVRPSRQVIYRVRPGDSLWRIAERRLGSGFRWREIFELNRGRCFGDGQELTNPRLIRPGWRLVLPEAHASKSAPVARKASAPRSDGGPTSSRRVGAARDTPAPSPIAEKSIDGQRPRATPVVRLPSGLALAGSFAAGIMSAELLGRLRRRRSARLDSQPEPLEDAPLVAQLRVAGAGTSARLEWALRAVHDSWRASRGTPPRVLFAVEEERRVFAILRDDGGPAPLQSGGNIVPLVRFRRASGHVLAEVRGPFASHPGRESRVHADLMAPLGRSREGNVVHASLRELGVASLTGSHASFVGRDLVLACTATSPPDDLEVILLSPSADVATLDRLPHSAGIARDWDAAGTVLRDLQAEFLRRARLFADEMAEDIWEHEARHPDDRLPRLVIVAGAPPPGIRGLVESIGQEGPRFGACLLAVGWEPTDSDLRIRSESGSILLDASVPVPTPLSPLMLDNDGAAQAIDVIRDAWTDPADSEETTDDRTGIPAGPPITIETLGESDGAAREPVASTPTPTLDVAVESAAAAGGSRLAVVPGAGIAVVRCLGSFQIERDARTLRKGWRSKARELVAYLAAHPDGASKDRIIDVLLPDMDADLAEAEFWRITSKIRAKVRTRDDARKYVEKVGESFRLEPEAWWIDVWEFMRLASMASDCPRDEQVSALTTAVGLYRGDFCDDCYYSWAEPIRERLRRTLIRAAARLAELLSDFGRSDEALATLERAIEVEPVNEELYRRAMTLEAAMGRTAKALSRYEMLVRVLSEQIGVDPEPASQELAKRIEEAKPPKRESYRLDSFERSGSEASATVGASSGNMP